MKVFVLFFLLFISTCLVAQSKKELIAEATRLEAENAALKNELTELKKPKEVDLNNPHQKASYGLGMLVASNLKNQGGDSLDLESILIGIQDVFLNRELKCDEQEASMTVQVYMQQAMEQKAAKMKAEGISFLAENRLKEGVKETASGLQYKVITTGRGKAPTANDQVTVHYTGKLIDGTQFDSSVERGEPATFGVSEVIRGWTEAIQLMHEGDKWMLYIPSELGYGERGAGGGQIPPHAVLIFEVELIKVN